MSVETVALARLNGKPIERHFCPMCNRTFVYAGTWYNNGHEIPCPPCWATGEYQNGNLKPGDIPVKPFKCFKAWRDNFCYVEEL